MTHDSIGLGEDGPTHQPVETLASLRAIPNMLVMRPADPIEVAECWEVALSQSSTPSVLALSRQAVPQLRTDTAENRSAPNLSAKGAYVLAEASGPRQATLIATGTEVSVAMEARDLLEADGIKTAVVSMPCWELFARQDAAYQARVLGATPNKVAVEAAIEFGWQQWIGPQGRFVGMKGFGASAPAGELYKQFGITAAAIAAIAKEGL
jgi:transketolase